MSNDVPGKEYSRDKRKKLLEADIQAYLPDIEEVTTTMSIAKMRASSVKGYSFQIFFGRPTIVSPKGK